MLFDYPRELRTNQALVVGMHAFFAKLGIASPIFIGASDGGIVAQIYTQKYPNEVGGLVLVFTGGMNAATLKTLKKKYFFVPLALWYMAHCNYERLKPRLIQSGMFKLQNKLHIALLCALLAVNITTTSTYLYVIKEWWNPQTFRSRFVGLANMALLLVAAATLLWILATKIKQNSTRLLLLVLFFLFPFGINVVYFISKGMEHTLMTFSFGLLYLLAVLFLQELPHNKTQKFLRYAAYAAMGLGIWCNVIYANQSYLKVALEEKATDALMVRVVGRLEQTEGYVPGETPIAVVGLLPTSPLYKTMDGFEDVRGRTADAYTVSWENTYYLYMENVLNYPVKRSYLTKDDQAAVDAMPTFPADGCCAFIGDTLVVKVGSVVVTDLQ